MEEFYKKIGKPAFYAILAIFAVGLVYSVSPKIGWALFLLIALVGIANIYASGMIKPAKGV